MSSEPEISLRIPQAKVTLYSCKVKYMCELEKIVINIVGLYIILQPEDFIFQTINAVNLRHLRVILLNGQRLDVICEPNNTGKQLFDTVVSHLGLPEHFFFGITYIQGTRV